jgi:hypothetical protein
VNPRRGTLGIVFIALFATTASAQEICGQLSKLMKDPPAGFVSQRAELLSPQRWASRSFLPNAKCVIWASRSGDADEIRCTINDGASPSIVAKFYQDTERSIDRCLAAMPGGDKYERRTARIESGSLKGVETVWIHDSDLRRFQVDLTEYRRTIDGTAYNSFSVQYLKY